LEVCADRGGEVFLASKAASAGIVFMLLAAGTSGPCPTPLVSGANLRKEAPAVGNGNDVKKMQQSLQDKGHCRGNIDGVLGLRTRSSIRGFQKAENLPVTGQQLDTQMAGRLGVRPEGREQTGYEAPKGKPSALIKWAKGRTSRALRNPVKAVAAPESRPGDREKKLQAENDNRPQ
jgi:peptidoglycan hydrolase-like protein with peptidoglycan-binding domain